MGFEEEEDDELPLAPCSEWPFGILCFCQLYKMSYKWTQLSCVFSSFFFFFKAEDKRSAVDEILGVFGIRQTNMLKRE